MIDTIVLILTDDMFQISDPDKFKPSAKWAIKKPISYATIGIQSKQNPTKKELASGIYKPRLTLFHNINLRDRQEIVLRIELSLPKLFFGNNFNELRNKDFKELITKLSEILLTMGVVVTPETLSKADVFSIHYSKNILLKDGSTPYHFINKIKNSNIKLSLDINQTDYRNDGHSYKLHTNSYEIVFYDKIKDLEKAKISDKRALEKDNALQLNIFDKIKKRKKLEVLRIEIRLNKRQKIKELLNSLKIKSNLTFKSLFKSSISKKIILNYLDELESKRPILFDFKYTNDKALLVALVFNNPNITPNKILQMFGLKKIMESLTLRELRQIFSQYNERSWHRLMSDTNSINLPVNQSSLKTLRSYVEKFKTIKL